MNEKSPISKSDKSSSTSVTMPEPTILSDEKKSDPRTKHEPHQEENI